jgi:hypothetical protein
MSKKEIPHAQDSNNITSGFVVETTYPENHKQSGSLRKAIRSSS